MSVGEITYEPMAELERARETIRRLENSLQDTRYSAANAWQRLETMREAIDYQHIHVIRQRAELATVSERYRQDFDTHALTDVTALLDMLDQVTAGDIP